MFAIHRYRTSKPKDGHFSLELHGDAEVVSFLEYWDTQKGWEVVVDAFVDTRQPQRRHYFFVCSPGDDLSPLGEYALSYLAGTNREKGYASFLFTTTHLSETERGELSASWDRLQRGKPEWSDLGRAQKVALNRERARRAQQHAVVPANGDGTSPDQEATDEIPEGATE